MGACLNYLQISGIKLFKGQQNLEGPQHLLYHLLFFHSD